MEIRTKSGRLLTEEEIEELVREAEAGYDIGPLLEREPRNPETLTVRVSPELKAQIEQLAEENFTTPGEILRAAAEELLARVDMKSS